LSRWTVCSPWFTRQCLVVGSEGRSFGVSYLRRTSRPLGEGSRRRGYRRISERLWSDRFKCRVGASKEWLTTRQILAVPRVENVDVKNKSGRSELAFPVQGTCWEKRLKENIIFRRSRRKVRASCRRCQARGTARDSGAMTSIESPSCSFLTRQPHSPNDRLFNPTQHSLTMSAVAKNAAKAAGRAASRLPDPHKRDEVLKKGAKRDPELYVRHSTSLKAHLHTDESCNRSFWVSCLVPLV
jgi:hypothetical protein